MSIKLEGFISTYIDSDTLGNKRVSYKGLPFMFFNEETISFPGYLLSKNIIHKRINHISEKFGLGIIISEHYMKNKISITKDGNKIAWYISSPIHLTRKNKNIFVPNQKDSGKLEGIPANTWIRIWSLHQSQANDPKYTKYLGVPVFHKYLGTCFNLGKKQIDLMYGCGYEVLNDFVEPEGFQDSFKDITEGSILSGETTIVEKKEKKYSDGEDFPAPETGMKIYITKLNKDDAFVKYSDNIINVPAEVMSDGYLKFEKEIDFGEWSDTLLYLVSGFEWVEIKEKCLPLKQWIPPKVGDKIYVNKLGEHDAYLSYSDKFINNTGTVTKVEEKAWDCYITFENDILDNDKDVLLLAGFKWTKVKESSITKPPIGCKIKIKSLKKNDAYLSKEQLFIDNAGIVVGYDSGCTQISLDKPIENLFDIYLIDGFIWEKVE